MLILLAALAELPALHAAPVIAEVGGEIAIGRNGNWGRIHPDLDGGWWFFMAAGGDYWMSHLPEDLTYDDNDRTSLTGRTDLQDQSIVRCPDGTWLHAASASVATPNDSLYAWRYAADTFERLGEVTVEERVAERAHNDPTLLCSDIASGVGVSWYSEQGGAFFPLEGDLDVGSMFRMDLTNFMGSSLIAREDDLLAVSVNGPGNTNVEVSTFDADLSKTSARSVRITDRNAFWPQGLHQLASDRYLLAAMVRDAPGGEGGDVHLYLLDGDFQVLETERLSTGVDGHRPWIARKGEQVIVMYDHDMRNWAIPVTLDLDGVDDVLEEVPGSRDGSGRSSADDIALAGCACASARGGDGLPALGLLAGATFLARRRRAKG